MVAEQFMLEWKRAESEDLIAERTRLKHGELSHQEGADDQVFQFLLMQAQQVIQSQFSTVLVGTQ
mgnify:CR=1 FL=1